MSVQSDPLVGRRFGNYVVERLLGAGGMGAVYCAVHPEIGKRVAIKFLAPDLASDATAVQRFFAEARAVNMIQHENIVDIFDFRVQDGQSYFVMELLPGRPLSAVLSQDGRLPLGRTLEIGVQIAAAISAAHSHGVLHRDLKPDNVFLSPKAGYENFVKVLDFGIAKLARPLGEGQPLTLRGMVMGTPGYMSPEQGTGETVDGRTDIYALGVMLFRALAGKLPFDAPTMAAMLNQQLKRKPPQLASIRKDLPESLTGMVSRMIQRNPDDRPQEMREVQERLVAVLVAQGGSATPSGRLAPVAVGWGSVPPSHLPPSGRVPGGPVVPSRKTQLGMLLAACVLSAGLVGGALWIRSRRTSEANAQTPPPSSAPLKPLPLEVPTTAPPTPRKPTGFRVYVESNPGGAEIFAGARRLGTTPIEVSLDGAQSLRLHLSGYLDEDLPVDDATHRVLVRLAKHGSARAKEKIKQQKAKGVAPPAHTTEDPEAEPETGLGLND
jgi:eukaryotic-like serine/threonine-protein kinase